MIRKAILIVDDDAALRDNLEDILSDEGYEPLSACSCADAMKLAGDRKIQAAILDLKLPDGTGTDLIADLKRINPDCTCMIMTGYADVESAIAAVQHGAYHYLQKPVNPNDLLNLIQKVFETIGLREEKRRAEEALIESERTTRALLNAFPSRVQRPVSDKMLPPLFPIVYSPQMSHNLCRWLYEQSLSADA